VFGVASVINLPMLDAIGRRNAIRFIMPRGELGGAHMADGFARASGGLGVVISSTGPGAANAVGGLVEARIAGTPVLHLASQTFTRLIDPRHRGGARRARPDRHAALGLEDELPHQDAATGRSACSPAPWPMRSCHRPDL